MPDILNLEDNLHLRQLGDGFIVIEETPLVKEEFGFRLKISNVPHVFTCNWVITQDNRMYQNVKVILAHGGWLLNNGRYYWFFANRQIVGDTVKRYNSVAQEPIDLVIACSGSVQSIEQNLLFPFDINTPEELLLGLPDDVTYIQGYNTPVQGFETYFEDNISLKLNAPLGNFRNFESLERRRTPCIYRENYD